MPPLSRLTPPEGFGRQQNVAAVFPLELTAEPLIYVVDDEPHLTELYTTILEATGCRVLAFNDRAEALKVLRRENRKPDLLVIDCLGNSMHADRFMKLCRAVCPQLRILMASGLSQSDVPFSSVRPDRFLQKPFTPEEFLHEVRAALMPAPMELNRRMFAK
jgi:DNA-binding response OmpR family regulator